TGLRYLHHMLEARSWTDLIGWCERSSVPYMLATRMWSVARDELAGEELEAVALVFARQMMLLGAFEHVETVRACELLSRSEVPLRRAWTSVMRAQAEVSAGRFGRAEVLLAATEEAGPDPVFSAEKALTTASVLRWRGELGRAAELVSQVANREVKGRGASSLAARA